MCWTLPFCFHAMRNADLWWHLAAGRLIVAGHAIPVRDPWSFTAAGQPWLNHEWLAQCIFYGWARSLGTEALTLWLFGILLLTSGLLQGALARWTGRPLVGLLGAVWAMAVASPFFEFRPHLYTLLGLALLLRWIVLLEAPDRWWMALVFVVWANLHSGVVLGLMVMGIWTLAWVAVGNDGAAAARGLRLSRAGPIFAGCLLASLLNPHGVYLIVYPLRVAWGGGTFRKLLEYLPPFSAGGLRPALYSWAIAACAAALLWLLGRGKLRERDSRLWTVTGTACLALAMSLVSARFIPVFAIAQAPLLAAALSAVAFPAARAARSAGRRAALRAALPVLAVLAGIAAAYRFPLRPDVFSALTGEESFPVEVANFMARNRLGGKVFCYAGWGGYLQWRLPGRLRVFYDSRADTVFDPETYRRYVQVQFLLPGWAETLEAAAADYFLWPRYPWRQLPNVSQARALLASGRWRLVYSDFASVLLARSNLALPSPLAATADSPYLRLALGIDSMDRGRPEEARRQLEQALRMNPRLLPACRNLAIVLAHTGRTADAEAMRSRCNAIFPDPATDAALAEELRHPHT